ncbi:hypothetical protein HaLaN_15573 [Haematococcus lacustris]|uniref:Uncharacterized protein n=1 Tax=Haematococcus lacustris TaxID=44745 RepID=A0A699ZRY7_HAELA|nr:hypothetical protein HaLaN_15573 [Haematococcus lacustris]
MDLGGLDTGFCAAWERWHHLVTGCMAAAALYSRALPQSTVAQRLAAHTLLLGLVLAAWRMWVHLKRRSRQVGVLSAGMPALVGALGRRRLAERAWLGWRLAVAAELVDRANCQLQEGGLQAVGVASRAPSVTGPRVIVPGPAPGTIFTANISPEALGQHQGQPKSMKHSQAAAQAEAQGPGPGQTRDQDRAGAGGAQLVGGDPGEPLLPSHVLVEHTRDLSAALQTLAQAVHVTAEVLSPRHRVLTLSPALTRPPLEGMAGDQVVSVAALEPAPSAARPTSPPTPAAYGSEQAGQPQVPSQLQHEPALQSNQLPGKL